MIGYVADAWRQRAVLSDVSHRPWPLPKGSWLMGQTWADLLFAHWRVPGFRVRGLRLRGTLPAAARRTYRLPYFRSRIEVRRDEEGTIGYDLVRTSDDGPPACFEARYGPEGAELPIEEGSLERWLTERYCLYTLDGAGRVRRGEIHHPPWPLHDARAEIETNTMATPFGIDLEGEPLLHFSPRQDVVIWPLRGGLNASAD